jgi:pimeloyl-ACP methyl ester carboxylesterase
MRYVLCVAILFALSSIVSAPTPLHAQTTCGSIVEIYGEDRYETPIEDCANPFGVVTENPNLRISFNTTQIDDGGTYPFVGATSVFALEGTHPEANMIGIGLYRTVPEGYEKINEDDNGEYSFATAGTYTVVVSENLLVVTQNFLQKLRSLFIPTVYAYPGVSMIVTFTVTEPMEEPMGISNILFLPGIQASRLYKSGLLGTEDRVWEPDGNQDVRQLAMTETGESVEDIYVRDIVEEAYGTIDVYKGFVEFMDGLVGAGTINDWEPFAYDWRHGVTDIAENGTLYEDGMHDAVETIETLAERSLSGKVTIIAHSNGGLLAKAILNRLEQEGKTSLVDKVIFLASPQLGTPEAIGTILHGYDQQKFGGLLIDDAEIRTVTKNMAGAYGLIPSQKYFEKSGSVPVAFDTSASTETFRTTYGTTIDSELELREFMVGDQDGRGEVVEIYDASRAQRAILENASADHGTMLDAWTAPEGVEVIEVVGVGLNTIHQFTYKEFREKDCLLCASKPIYKPVPQFSPFGDGTVMGYSAEGYSGEKKTWYVDLGEMDRLNDSESAEHKDFGNSSYIQSLIQNVLLHTTSTIPFITSELPSFSGTSYTILSTHSPVTLEIVDSEGRRVGRGESAPQTDIPGSTYAELAGSTYIVVPQGIEYDVTIKGTGNGSMTFVTESLSDDVQVRTSFAEVATITPSTTIALSYAEDTFSNLVIDTNGDTIVDQELTPQGEVVIPKGTYLVLRNAIKALPIKYGYKRHLLALTNIAEHFDKKALSKKRFAKIELRILIHIEQTLKHAVKKKQLTQAQITPILKIINTLK